MSIKTAPTAAEDFTNALIKTEDSGPLEALAEAAASSDILAPSTVAIKFTSGKYTIQINLLISVF